MVCTWLCFPYWRINAISWQSCKEPNVVFSSIKSKYIDAIIATKEALWLWQLFKDLGFFKDSLMCFVVIINQALNSLKMFVFIIDQSTLNYNSTSCQKMLISKNSNFILCQLKLCGLVLLTKLCPSPTCILLSSYGNHFITFIAKGEVIY